MTYKDGVLGMTTPIIFRIAWKYGVVIKMGLSDVAVFSCAFPSYREQFVLSEATFLGVQDDHVGCR